MQDTAIRRKLLKTLRCISKAENTAVPAQSDMKFPDILFHLITAADITEYLSLPFLNRNDTGKTYLYDFFISMPNLIKGTGSLTLLQTVSVYIQNGQGQQHFCSFPHIIFPEPLPY
jgi:hypothetical protein